ncbi:uroporphyrinogen-III synthase [Pelagovum pacificum]|uniref:Uroporphyrinogen-III synthase n=2 Tax=Pelagovum pacificum TaxID=2588711 RepID=A0A5C5GK00_9RHOB|nr:uroporphyrinogen-III synthase [Pelagovum pacificum]QQA42740.1 uroporphyrinogen-III synthase [Pelagovum pacificum]TNY34109.1 uroporphyrinogen-III synthase [Pelagovum pacificum]
MRPVLLVTRPAPDGARFAEAVARETGQPFDVLQSPLIGIRPRDVSVAERPDALVLTSANGAAQIGRLQLSGLPAFCVGDRTAACAEKEGATAVSAGGDAEALIATILAQKPLGRLLHLRGAHSRGDVAGRLSANGQPCEALVVYDQQPESLTSDARRALAAEAPAVVPLFSPRTAALMADQGPFRGQLHVVAMSEAVAKEAARLSPASLVIASSPEGAAMIALTSRRLEYLLSG